MASPNFESSKATFESREFTFVAKLLAFFCRTDLLCLQAAVRASWIWGAVRERAKLSLAFCSVWAEGEEGRHKQHTFRFVPLSGAVPKLSIQQHPKKEKHLRFRKAVVSPDLT